MVSMRGQLIGTLVLWDVFSVQLKPYLKPVFFKGVRVRKREEKLLGIMNARVKSPMTLL